MLDVFKDGIHVMLDLESLGTEPGSVILSISALSFRYDEDKQTLVEGTSREVHISATSSGLDIDPSTVLWWLEQSEKARAIMLEGQARGMDEEKALEEFAEWIKDLEDFFGTLYIYGNSTRFDLGLLNYAYRYYGEKAPWDHTKEIDYRTIRKLFPECMVPFEEFVGTPHKGLDDCRHQFKGVKNVFDKYQSQFSEL